MHPEHAHNLPHLVAAIQIHGVSARINLTNWNGLSVFFTAGHTVANFFRRKPVDCSSIRPADRPVPIDHDQKFQQTTQVQYSFDSFKKFSRFRPFIAFTWKYDSGLVAGSVPDFATALGLSADEQQQIGLYCGNVFATISNRLQLVRHNLGALRLRIPPPELKPCHKSAADRSAKFVRSKFGSDNVTRTEKVKMSARLTLVNLTNKHAVYNFNSTFSGTHFIAPRTIQAQFGITF